MVSDIAFLHGGGQGSWVWQETIAAFNQQRTNAVGSILTLDVPGCGTKRNRDTSALSLDDVVNELLADIEAAGLERVVLVGHSQAGQVMSLMLARRPELFSRLVYVSCSIPSPGQTVIQLMGGGLHGENETEVGWPAISSEADMAARSAIMFCNDMAPAQADSFLARLGSDMWPMQSYAYTAWNWEAHGAVASTYVLCMQDMSLPPDWQRVFAERFNCEKIVHIDAGHQVMNTRPQALAEVLLFEIGNN